MRTLTGYGAATLNPNKAALGRLTRPEVLSSLLVRQQAQGGLLGLAGLLQAQPHLVQADHHILQPVVTHPCIAQVLGRLWISIFLFHLSWDC